MPPLETNTGKPIMIIFSGIISAGGKNVMKPMRVAKSKKKKKKKKKGT